MITGIAPPSRRWSGIVTAVGLGALVATAGCATRPDPVADPEGYAEFVEINDPIEPFNRAVFAFNRGVDTVLLTPLGIFYRDIVPPIMQKGVGNVLKNMRTPIVLINDLLQGNPDRAGTTFARFIVNTTVGLGGLMDTAAKFGLEYHDEDFGQTLAVWGTGEGPFLMLPLLGPSNPRDAVGRAVDSLVFDPFGFLFALVFADSTVVQAISYTRTGLTLVEARAVTLDPLDELERSSLDFYAAIRSAYRQNRDFQIQQPGKTPGHPDENSR